MSEEATTMWPVPDLDLAIRALRGNFDHYPEIGRLRAALNERKEA